MDPETFQQATALSPRAIAGNVSHDDAAFCAWAEARAVRLYASNPGWRTLLHSPNGRNWLTTFITRWWWAWQQSPR